MYWINFQNSYTFAYQKILLHTLLLFVFKSLQSILKIYNLYLTTFLIFWILLISFCPGKQRCDEKKKNKISYTLPLIAFLNFNTFHIWKGKEMDFWIVKDDKREMHYVSTLKCLIMVSPTLQPLFSLFCKTPTVILIQPLSLPPPIINLRCWYMKIQLFIFVFLTSQ